MIHVINVSVCLVLICVLIIVGFLIVVVALIFLVGLFIAIAIILAIEANNVVGYYCYLSATIFALFKALTMPAVCLSACLFECLFITVGEIFHIINIFLAIAFVINDFNRFLIILYQILC